VPNIILAEWLVRRTQAPIAAVADDDASYPSPEMLPVVPR
jgi:hypothetical protein